MPRPVRIFHITAIDNLNAIFRHGKLLSKAESKRCGVEYHNIAHSDAQRSRSIKTVPITPGGNIHDYVPFYFAPRSPMLMAIDRGNVQDCNYSQNDIVHFELYVRKIYENGSSYVFYDRNATKPYSVPYNDLNQLEQVVAWDLLTESPLLDGFCKFFFDRHDPPKYMDRMEKRQAEFMIKESVSVELINRIGVFNDSKAEIVRQLLNSNGINLRVEVVKDWYFNGQ